MGTSSMYASAYLSPFLWAGENPLPQEECRKTGFTIVIRVIVFVKDQKLGFYSGAYALTPTLSPGERGLKNQFWDTFPGEGIEKPVLRHPNQGPERQVTIL